MVNPALNALRFPRGVHDLFRNDDMLPGYGPLHNVSSAFLPANPVHARRIRQTWTAEGFLTEDDVRRVQKQYGARGYPGFHKTA